jgi:predicted exporter
MTVEHPGSAVEKFELIRSGSEDFLPSYLAKTLSDFSGFPASKWGFVTYDIKFAEKDWAHAEKICTALKEVKDPDAGVECFLSPLTRANELKDWARDYPLRHEYPGNDSVPELINNTIAKVMVMPDRDLVNLMRTDPFGSVDELMARVADKNLIQLSAKNSFLYDVGSERVVIPLQFHHEPMQTELTQKFIDAVHQGCEGDTQCIAQTGFTGGFFASVENKKQIMADLSIVGWLTIIILALFLGGILFSGRGRLFALIAPVGAGLLAGCLAMILFFNGIHGLVLSFGAGLIGLSVDYGIHAALNRDKHVWQNNFYALFSTVAVLLVISFSSIPLMRQLMIFTIVGLTVSYVLIFLMFRWCDKKGLSLSVKPLKHMPNESNALGVVMLALAGLGMAGFFLKNFDLNLHRLNYMPERSAEITMWLHERMGKVMPLFHITNAQHPRTALTLSHEERDLAIKHSIRLENLAGYVPPIEVQEKNHASWFSGGCSPLANVELAKPAQEFFAPYLQSFTCELVKPVLPGAKNLPSYVGHLFSGPSWLSIWMPSNPDQEREIRAKFPNVFSLMEMMQNFPKLLMTELKWMLPTAIVLILLMLLFYFRNFYHALISLVPFFSGMGTVFSSMWLIGLDVNFIVIISMLMLCGLSTDYGIFAVDHQRRVGDKSDRSVATSAMLLSALSTSAGMIPLVFCDHPVLLSLGLPMCTGILGALGGAFWAVPFLDKLVRQKV